MLQKPCPVEYHEFDMSNDLYDKLIYISPDTIIYLSANGEIRIDCDTAYENMDYTIGHIEKDSLEAIVMGKAKSAVYKF